MIVVPTGKTDPEAKPAINEVDGEGQLSVPTGATNETAAPQTPASEFKILISEGQVIAGASSSETVTTKKQGSELFPAASVAVTVTHFEPLGKLNPFNVVGAWNGAVKPGFVTK